MNDITDENEIVEENKVPYFEPIEQVPERRGYGSLIYDKIIDEFIQSEHKCVILNERFKGSCMTGFKSALMRLNHRNVTVLSRNKRVYLIKVGKLNGGKHGQDTY